MMPPGIVETLSAPPSRAVNELGSSAGLRGWLFTWGAKGSLALVDQALFAGAQFAVNILLARWLTTAAYGVFAIAYSIYLLASSVHSALLVEPMVVFGSGRYFQQRKSYLNIVLRGHSLLMLPTGIVLLTAGFVMGRLNSLPLGHALYSLALALPLTLLSELTRRAFYIEMQPGRAAVGGAIYCGSLVLAVCGLHAAQLITPATAILAMGAAALLTSSTQLSWLGSRWPNDSASLPTLAVATEHWVYGRWVLASAFPLWTFPNLFYLVLPLHSGLEESGALKAILNLAMPAAHALIAVGMLAIPLLVSHRRFGGLPLLRQTVRWLTALFVIGSVVYLAALWVFRNPIIHLFYGGKYAEYSGLPVFLAGLVPLVMAMSVSSGVALRALERPDLMFWANVAASAVAVTLGLYLTLRWGATGALGGHLASFAVCASTMWLFYGRILVDESCESGGTNDAI